jgi:hypothetical protein
MTQPLATAPAAVYEPESGLTGTAEVTEVDRDRRLVYLAVDWSRLRVQPPAARPGIAAILHQLAEAIAEWLRRGSGGSRQTPNDHRRAA